MPRFFFDVQDTGPRHDDTGTECADLAEARAAAMRLLPDLLGEELPDGDHRVFTLLVRDEARRPVFSATLSLIGLWLTEER